MWAFLGVAVVGFGVGVALAVASLLEPAGPGRSTGVLGSGFVPGAMLALGLVGVGFGVPLLVAAVRTRDERFEVYERGLVHHVADTARVVEWAAIASVRPRGTELDRGGPHTLGIDFSCIVRLADGGRLRFTSFTADATALAARIEAGVRHAVLPEPH